MIDIIKSSDRHFTDMGWLQTFWLFSFSDYWDPGNVSHGMLRVFNDDVVAPRAGFDTHPHEEMEIVSIILDGEMVHEDTMGNKTVIRADDVQRMTAGTGLYHSEKNDSDRPVHFYQIWIKPDKKGLVPSYDQRSFTPSSWHNRLALLASDRPDDGAVALNTRAALYRAALDKGNSVQYTPKASSRPFIYVIGGSIEANGVAAEKNDQVRIHEGVQLDIHAREDGEFILIDVPA